MQEDISQKEPEDDGLFEHHQIKVDPKQDLLRIDKFLMDRLPNVTRNKVQKAIKDGFVQVNGETIKPNYKVHPNDAIRIALPEPPRDSEVKPENIPLEIVYEDSELLIGKELWLMLWHIIFNNYLKWKEMRGDLD